MKYCIRCNKEKPLSEFPDNKRNKDGKYTYCVLCKREEQREGYLRNKHKRLDAVSKRRAERHEFVNSYKIERGCEICGWDKHSSALEFHHDDNNKEHNVSQMVGHNLDKIKAEMDKCMLLCSNCHRIKHAGKYAKTKS
ncbi:HNH endonuclease [Vibrio phage VPp1]|nr:HNH endonuclease [Vibrio phage VPp1]